MDTIVAGQEPQGYSGPDLVVPLSVDHLAVVDQEPWNPFEPGWETAEDDGPPMSEPARELTNTELLHQALMDAMDAQERGLVLAPPLLGNSGQFEQYFQATSLAEQVDAAEARAAAERAATYTRYALDLRFSFGQGVAA